MKIVLLYVGKTDDSYLKEGVLHYLNRLKRYINTEELVIPSLKNTKNISIEEQKTQEGKLILKIINNTDRVILLDEKGKQHTSIELSSYLQSQMLSGSKRLFFVIGGPYGFSKEVYERAEDKIALSKLTFSHQMVRLFLMEQLYRAMTILKNEPYHHR